MKARTAFAVIGGAVILAIVVVGLAIGLQSPQGQSFLQPMWDGLTNLWRQLVGVLPANPAAGNLGLAAAIGAVGFLVTELFVGPARASRGAVVATAAIWALIGLLLYSPGIVT